ncbi:DUF4145 domain-containing protein (plasmid) [Rhizobium leguminosarum]
MLFDSRIDSEQIQIAEFASIAIDKRLLSMVTAPTASHTSYFPQFVCRRCHKGNLTAKDKYKREPKHVTNDLRDHDMQGEESEGRFIALLSCNNRLCGEIVAVAGDYVSHATIDKGPDGGLEQFWDDTFRPTSMHPAPSIITWPKSLDELPKMHLMVSFELFWVDAAACASRLRIFIETLLDQLGVSREGIKRNGKKGMLDLSERIDELDKVKPGHKSALDALRHVGNFGSHERRAGLRRPCGLLRHPRNHAGRIDRGQAGQAGRGDCSDY